MNSQTPFDPNKKIISIKGYLQKKKDDIEFQTEKTIERMEKDNHKPDPEKLEKLEKKLNYTHQKLENIQKLEEEKLK